MVKFDPENMQFIEKTIINETGDNHQSRKQRGQRALAKTTTGKMNVVRARAFAEIDKFLAQFSPKEFDDNAKALEEIEIYIAQHFSKPWIADNLSVQNQGLDRRYRNMFNQFVSVIGCYDDIYKYYSAALQRAPRRAPVAASRLANYSLLDSNAGKASAAAGMDPSVGYEMGLPSLDEFHKPLDFKKFLDIYDPKDHKKFIYKFAEDLEKGARSGAG